MLAVAQAVAEQSELPRDTLGACADRSNSPLATRAWQRTALHVETNTRDVSLRRSPVSHLLAFVERLQQLQRVARLRKS